MDIFDMKKEYGITDDGDMKHVVPLMFKIDPKGNITARFSGSIVFRDADCRIGPDEMWICSLERNTSLSNAYNAIPIERVDNAFLLELSSDKVEDIANALWNDPNARKRLQPILGKTAKESDAQNKTIAELKAIRSDLEKQIRELNADFKHYKANSIALPGGDRMKDQYMREINEYFNGNAGYNPENPFMDFAKALMDSGLPTEERKQFAELKERAKALEGHCGELEDNLKDAESKLSSAEEQIKTLQQPGHLSSNDELVEMIRNTVKAAINETKTIPYPINRVDGSTFYSRSFTEERYTVLISPNKKKMLIRPDENGTVLCSENKMSVYGLEEVVPFKMPYSVIYECEEDGTMVLSI